MWSCGQVCECVRVCVEARETEERGEEERGLFICMTRQHVMHDTAATTRVLPVHGQESQHDT